MRIGMVEKQAVIWLLLSFFVVKGNDTFAQTYSDSIKVYQKECLEKLKKNRDLSKRSKPDHLNFYEPNENFRTEATLIEEHVAAEKKDPDLQKDLIVGGALRTISPSLGYAALANPAYYRSTTKEKYDRLHTSSGEKTTYIVFGRIKFWINGEGHIVTVYKVNEFETTGQNLLIIPFTDKTNGKETYLSGRYITLLEEDFSAENKVLLDFNKAQNPLCAYEKGLICIIPPKKNHLKVKIEAGEKNFY